MVRIECARSSARWRCHGLSNWDRDCGGVMATAAILDFQPIASGHKLDRKYFGFFRDSAGEVDNVELLRERMREDGYLYLKHFYDREAVLAARKVVTDRLV